MPNCLGQRPVRLRVIFVHSSAMHVISTWSAPSAVYFSSKLGETVLVLARASRVEVVRLLEDGINHICGIDLWGKITSLNVLNESVCLTVPVISDAGCTFRVDELAPHRYSMCAIPDRIYTGDDRPSASYGLSGFLRQKILDT